CFSAPDGWELVARASGSVRARISQHFLEASTFSRCRTVEFGHTTQTEKYPHIHVVNPAAWSCLKSGLVEVAGQLVSIEMLARHRERLRAIGDHPFAKWQDGIDGLIECIPDDDYSTLPSPPRAKEARKEELPFWLALSAHCERAEVGVDPCRAIY